MNYGKVEGRSSSRSRSPSTARRAATSAILTDILSRLDRARTLLTVDARPGKSILIVPGELSPTRQLGTGKRNSRLESSLPYRRQPVEVLDCRAEKSTAQ